MPLKSEVESPVFRSLVQIWCNASVSRSLPRKHEIDPVDLARIGVLPIVWLLERRDGELYCRLAGEDIINAIGQPVRGRKITDIYDPPSSEVIIKQWQQILDTCSTCHNKGAIIASQGRQYLGERLALPLADKAGDARFILGATLYKRLQSLFPVEDTVSFIHKEPAVFTPYQDVLSSFEQD